MRARFNIVLSKLTSLLWKLGEAPLYCLWIARERWPKLFGGLWPMIHRPEWQKNTFQNIAFWLVATPVIFYAARRTGHNVASSVTISFSMDILGFGINKLWTWRKRQVDSIRSGGRSVVVWGVTFALNGLLAWLVIHRVGLQYGRALQGVYGIAVNPLMFAVRDRMVFGETATREAAMARCQLELSKAMAVSHIALRMTGMA